MVFLLRVAALLIRGRRLATGAGRCQSRELRYRSLDGAERNPGPQSWSIERNHQTMGNTLERKRPMTDKPIIDLRIYTIRPRGMPEYLKLFEELALPVAQKHLGAPLGYYVSQIGPLNQVVHLWAFESLADLERRMAAVYADPDFAKYLAATAGLVVAQEDRIVRRVDFKSPS
jgi:hypothetical protein